MRPEQKIVEGGLVCPKSTLEEVGRPADHAVGRLQDDLQRPQLVARPRFVYVRAVRQIGRLSAAEKVDLPAPADEPKPHDFGANSWNVPQSSENNTRSD